MKPDCMDRGCGNSAVRDFPPGAGVALAPIEDAWSGQSWYVAYTKPRQEETARQNLDRQGYLTYLPRIKLLKRRMGRHQACFEPMFPRYLFVRPGAEAQSIAPIRSTTGVTALVRFGVEPATVRQDLLRAIRELELLQSEASDHELSPFRPGSRVNIADGPFAGIEGIVSAVSQQRVIVLMNLLGRDTRVSMSCHQLMLAA